VIATFGEHNVAYKVLCLASHRESEGRTTSRLLVGYEHANKYMFISTAAFSKLKSQVSS